MLEGWQELVVWAGAEYWPCTYVLASPCSVCCCCCSCSCNSNGPEALKKYEGDKEVLDAYMESADILQQEQATHAAAAQQPQVGALHVFLQQSRLLGGASSPGTTIAAARSGVGPPDGTLHRCFRSETAPWTQLQAWQL
jgi:hypothetical protein